MSELKTQRNDASGREGDWMLSGFSPRKRDLVVYVMAGFSHFEEILSRLGPHSTYR